MTVLETAHKLFETEIALSYIIIWLHKLKVWDSEKTFSEYLLGIVWILSILDKNKEKRKGMWNKSGCTWNKH